jgi:hypothetical protein
MLEMRRVVGKAREMQIQRDSLVQQLREAITSDDITSKLLARTSDAPDDIFQQELEKHAPSVCPLIFTLCSPGDRKVIIIT